MGRHRGGFLCQNRSALNLALFSFYQVRLKLASLRCSDGYALTLQYNLHSFSGRRGHVLNFVKNRGLELRAVGLIGNSQRDVERVVVNLRMTAHKILVTQHLSHAQDLRCLLAFI